MFHMIAEQSNRLNTESQIPHPESIEHTYMGGVDLFDSHHKTYSCSHKSKKWWTRISYFLLDAYVTNMYILNKETSRTKPLTIYCMDPQMYNMQIYVLCEQSTLKQFMQGHSHHNRSGKKSSAPLRKPFSLPDNFSPIVMTGLKEGMLSGKAMTKFITKVAATTYRRKSYPTKEEKEYVGV